MGSLVQGSALAATPNRAPTQTQTLPIYPIYPPGRQMPAASPEQLCLGSSHKKRTDSCSQPHSGPRLPETQTWTVQQVGACVFHTAC
jgi:hypothetical protein